MTVRRNEGTNDIDLAHVLLTFGFDTAVSPTEIEIDLFHCPEQGIGTPRITIYVNQEYNLTFKPGLNFLPQVVPSQSSCDSLLTVGITGNLLPPYAQLSYHAFHILVDLNNDPSIEWEMLGPLVVHLLIPLPPSPSPTTTLPSPYFNY